MNISTHPVTSAVPLVGADYLPYIYNKIDTAHSRIWASIFIIDARVDQDEFCSVRTLLDKLSYASWRKVDVRVIVGTATIVDVYIACLASAYYMKKRGINIRTFASETGRKSTHSKYMLFDDNLAVVSSSNWSHDTFHRAVNSSLAVESDGLAESLSQRFLSAWQTAAEVTDES